MLAGASCTTVVGAPATGSEVDGDVLGSGLEPVQGIAQVFRCIICIRTGEWLAAAEDIEETEIQRRPSGLLTGQFRSTPATKSLRPVSLVSRFTFRPFSSQLTH